MLTMRKATLEDVYKIMCMIEEGRVSLAEMGLSQWQNGYPNEITVVTDIERGESWIVEDEENNPVGTVVIGLEGDPRYDRIFEGEWLSSDEAGSAQYATVHRVAVSSQGKGKGVATFMMREAALIAESNGCSSLRVDTHPSNIPMRRVAEKAGFDYCGIILGPPACDAETAERVAFERLLADDNNLVA